MVHEYASYDAVIFDGVNKRMAKYPNNIPRVLKFNIEADGFSGNALAITSYLHWKFYDGDKSISIDKWDIRSLNSSYPKGTPLIVKPAEEAGSAPEFIVNVPSDRKPKLVREALN
ncbi:hypothetical protein HZH66_014686 [Vespula vulgaris]|uniref:Uncharacterized protein n=1 Tax=Vespula vulgaris TaxID=7454 RepID=A0A834IZU2_VESVU|nr:hypothetical protein HZH66_014686 [Vespula vulgaris]